MFCTFFLPAFFIIITTLKLYLQFLYIYFQLMAKLHMPVSGTYSCPRQAKVTRMCIYVRNKYLFGMPASRHGHFGLYLQVSCKPIRRWKLMAKESRGYLASSDLPAFCLTTRLPAPREETSALYPGYPPSAGNIILLRISILHILIVLCAGFRRVYLVIYLHFCYLGTWF